MERLVVDGWGRFIGVENNQIVVKERKGKTQSVIFRCIPSELKQVVLSGKGSISTDAIELLSEYSVDLIILNWKGDVCARLSPPLMRTVNTRREQYRCYNTKQGVELSKAFIYAKMKNMMAVLGTLAKTRVHIDPDTAEVLRKERDAIELNSLELKKVDGNCCDAVRSIILGLEGNATGKYWGAISHIIDSSFGFQGRSGRYASDPVNALLNYGYAILESECWRAVHFAGLDPYGGFLHVDRPGKASMVYDLMEEFRQQIVDKIVIKLLSLKQVKSDDFTIIDGICKMEDNTRKLLLNEILTKLEDKVRYKDKVLKWSDIILHQAREVAKFLKGEIKNYTSFWLRW